MPNNILNKRKTTAGAPALGDMQDGEFCFGQTNNIIYARINGVIKEFRASEVVSQAVYDGLTPDDETIYLITS